MDKEDSEYQQLGARLAALRKLNKLSQKELALKLDISQQLLANYELGQRRIHVFQLLKIANFFHTDIDSLLHDKAAKKKPGPTSRIQKLTERIKELPVDKQKRVIDNLEFVLLGAEKE